MKPERSQASVFLANTHLAFLRRLARENTTSVSAVLRQIVEADMRAEAAVKEVVCP